MKIDKAIETMKYNRHLLGIPEQGNTWRANANTIACDMAIEVLEQQKESKRKVKISTMNGLNYCECGHFLHNICTYCSSCGGELEG